MIKIELNKKQFAELEGLSYWIADLHYMRERFGDDEPELIRCRKTIELSFDVLDSLGVPHWVQNTVICWAEN